jgi:hypothetical protein
VAEIVEKLSQQYKNLWEVREIEKCRHVFQTKDTVIAKQVAAVIELVAAKGWTAHINGGTHGTRDGHHAADAPPGKASSYGEAEFTLEDMDTIRKIHSSASFHAVARGSFPIYPSNAVVIINAWCYSDGKGCVQPGSMIKGLFPVGGQVWFTGQFLDFGSGYRLTYGLAGTVDSPHPDCHPDPDRLCVKFDFEGNTAVVHTELTELSTEMPPILLRGFRVGQTVWWPGKSEYFGSGNRVMYGLAGTVDSPHPDPDRLFVKFEGNNALVHTLLTELSTKKPPIDFRGFRVGQTVWYTGLSCDFENGDRVTYGLAGTVDSPHPDPDRLRVKFEGTRRLCNTWLTDLTTTPSPALFACALRS